MSIETKLNSNLRVSELFPPRCNI